MPINSRAKGAQGEREWAAYLKQSIDPLARRGVQYSGSADSPDVFTALPLHFEVKRVEKLNIDQAKDQATRDCGEKLPIVAHRKNRKEWLVTIKAKDLMDLTMILGAVAPIE